MLKHVSIVLGGNGIAQLIVVATAPILSRIYLPADFGVLAIFNSIVAIIAVISSLRYEITIPLTNTKLEAVNMVALCVFILLCFCLSSALVIYFFGKDMLTITNNLHFLDYIWLVPIGIFVLGGYQVLNYVGIREKDYSAIAKSRISQSIFSTTIQIFMYKFTALGLIFGQVVGLLVALLVLNITVLRKRFVLKVKLSTMRNLARRYINFPKYSTWEGILFSLSVEIPIFIVAIFYSTHEAGIYMLVTKILTMPAGLIINSVSQVYYGHIANFVKRSDISALTYKIHINLFKLATPLLIIGFFTAGDIFGWIFGENFSEGGALVPYMMLAVYFQLQAATLTPLIGYYNKQQKGMIWNFFLLFTRMLALLSGVIFFDFYVSIILYAFTGAFMYFILLLWLFQLADLNVGNILKSDLRILVYSIGCTMPIVIGTLLFQNVHYIYILLCGALGIYTLYYYYKYIGFKENFFGEIVPSSTHA
jgi:O-antigen/teichoic acid export membrane protein